MLMVPFVEPAIIKHLQVILDNKRDNVIFKTFFEKDKSADTPIAVLERMNALEVVMECNDLFERMIRNGIIAGQQFGSLRFDFFRRGGISPADLVRNAFIFANSKPVFPGIACAVF